MYGDNEGRRGAILATVVVIATVMFLLVGVAYTYFAMNSRTMIYTTSRARALTRAEAGVALALHYLQSLDEKPAAGEPIILEMEADSSGWTLLPGGGRALVVIDPLNSSGGPLSNGAVQIRSRGIAGGITMDIFAGAAPAYPSSYALLTDRGIGSGFFTDGRTVNGSIHSNGVICFSSYTPDSTDDPSGEMFSTTSQGGFQFGDAGLSDVPHPDGSSIWVRPYSRHRQGSPFWRPNAPPIDFTRMTQYFRGIAYGGESSGVIRISGQRVLLDGERLRFKQSENGDERAVALSNVDVVIIDNGFSSVTIKSIQRLQHPLTIIAKNDLIIGGGIDGSASGSGGPLGLVSLGDIIVAQDPDVSGSNDWSGQWDIETDHAFLIRASLAVPSGSFRAQVPYEPGEMTRVTVNGSLTQSEMGRLSSANSGYELGISWDQGLGALHPPHFPMLGRWNVYSWLVDPPNRGDSDIEDDLV